MSAQVNKSTILIVDDDPVQRRILQAAIENMGYKTWCCKNGEAAIDALSGPHSSDIDAMVLDLMMPGIDGHGVLKFMREQGINKPTIVQTAQGGMDTAVKAMRAGAFDFVIKPVSPDRLKSSLCDALKIEAVKSTPKKQSIEATFNRANTQKMIASTDTMNRVAELVKRAANSDIPVLIEGESGTGKELIAKSIQASSDRANKPLVIVNCGAIPENLVESILFGHEKGAFTGATEKHTGKFVEANGGTLFLDEIGELPLSTQVKILRAIQEGEVEPVGSSTSRKVNIRLISATNRDLIAAVRENRFREDLYYRLNVFPILVPPLRNRRGDIRDLAEHFIARHNASQQGFAAQAISDAAIHLLERYDWPGNIRQLENTIFRAMVLCDRLTLDLQDFQHIAAQVDLPAATHQQSQIQAVNAPELAPNYPIGRSDVDIAPSDFDTELSNIDNLMLENDGHIRPLVEIERLAIKHAITHYNGQMSEVARRLGIGRSTLYRKLKEFGIEPETLVE
ncbi:sigma-54 dependent transcriptional regulator [Ahrensia kielensis]|uniref:DNA-binding transcriptional regulator NtrC n=1 Tax=Ahrensia kielensis TaxID=76980 RepID=A0ABU9T6R7_9HYPH